MFKLVRGGIVRTELFMFVRGGIDDRKKFFMLVSTHSLQQEKIVQVGKRRHR